MKKLNIISIVLLLFMVACQEEKVEEIREVNGISVSPWETPTSFEINEKLQFVAYNKPDFEEATEVVWSVDSPSGAVVVDEKTGFVTGVKKGWGKVIATSTVTNLSDTSYVVVGEDSATIDFIRFDTPIVDAVVGREVKVEALTTPYNVSDLGLIQYRPDDLDKASVDKNGVVRPKVVGVTNIFAEVIRTDDREVITASIRVNVMPVVAIEEIIFAETELLKSRTEEFELDFTFLPENSNDTLFNYFVSDTTVLTVNPENGKVVGKGVGEAFVYVSNDRFLSKAVKVKVIEPVLAEGVKLHNPLTKPLQFAGQTVQIETIFTPEDTFNKKGTWTSSDESVVTVDENGLTTATGDGEATITFVSEDGGFTDAVTVAVNTIFYYFTPDPDDVIPNITYSTRDIDLVPIDGQDHLGNTTKLYQVTKTRDGWSLIDIRTTKPINTDYSVEFKIWVKIPKQDVELEQYDMSLSLYSADKSKRFFKQQPVTEVTFDEWTEYTFNFDDQDLEGVDLQVIEFVFAHGFFEEAIGIQYLIEGLKGPHLRD
ncbi:Ig-like domain-containing protein [Flammeovirga aprica]|uniref:BIG2 domain-containing protein n=1 Tax=Flammeovirga aprica JL-4 TaxID=694437 RepID=A0A7X9RWU7_9BACT|nr:Ig-like domain-containing protein [Flammeovirga aprica]NME70218.1 hypothetical protein [Flammeovirga aprica JL-4]